MKRTLIAAALIVTATSALANPTVEKSGMLTSRDGRTLYTFDKDQSGKSNCNGACIAAWPAFTVANAALAGGNFSIITRDDGVAQWAFKGKPLYFFAGDAKSGDANGDNQGGVWHVVRTEVQKSSSYDQGPAISYGY
jgi:predicted lipoprotein with Yx(FWY)xxD motif